MKANESAPGTQGAKTVGAFIGIAISLLIAGFLARLGWLLLQGGWTFADWLLSLPGRL